VFLELPGRPVSATFTRGDEPALEHEIERLAGGAITGEFTVAPEPCRAICGGCPGEGGLCSWPLELTRRERPEPDPPAAPEAQGRLF
jgi:hypothetical protein